MERKDRTGWCSTTLLSAITALSCTGSLHADGTEQLGPPSIPIADGSAVVTAGVGLRGFNGQPNSIEITIPAGVTIQQVLLYWNGFAFTADQQGEMDTILVDGASVTGDRIGGPNFFFNNAWSSTYRAELSTDLLGTGTNSVEIDGLDFNRSNNGAGLLVIVDDGMTSTDIQVVDGDDTAFSGFPPPRDTTVPVTYSFTPAAGDRVGDLKCFVASVFTDTCRPNTLQISFDGVLTDVIDTPFSSADGEQWDSYETSVTVPAGATSMTVQAVSENVGDTCPPDALDASLVWCASTFSLTSEMQPPTGACCISGHCSIETEADCLAMGGGYFGDGTHCGMVDCGGACCLSDGTCIDGVTEAECAAEGGEFQGSGTDCTMVHCGGACCLPDGTCLDGLTAAQCDAEGGEFQGQGTDCLWIDCGGACCLPDGTCMDGLTEMACTAEGGEFQGSGTNCMTVDCSGACCLSDGQCIDGVTESECDQVGGTFQGPGSDCGSVDCSGACCLSDGQCIDGVTELECDQVGGTFQGPGTDCGSVDCSGACCLSDGQCIDGVTESECDQVGGTFQGGGTDCSVVDCTGACCILDGTCIDGVTEAECAAEGGEFQGGGTDCSVVDCTGACCIPDGTCIDGVTEAGCAAEGGEFQGGGTNCMTVDCSGACCLSDGTCIDGVTEMECFVQGGEFQGGGTNCSTVDCTGACCIPIGPQGGCIDGLTEAECLAENGEFQGSGTSCDTAECPTCDLTVDVEGCVVIPPPSGTDDCDGKVEELTLRYTGEDCSASNAPQEGSAECSGDPNFASPVRIRVSDKSDPFDGGAKVYFDGTVSLDGELNATAANAGENDFASNTYVHVLTLSDSVLQTNTVHTSCSKPLAVGNQFGAMLVTRMVTTNGGEVVLPPDEDECITEVVLERGDACDGKVTELLLEYTGEDCSATSNNQDGDTCSGDPSFASPVRIRVSNKENPFDGGAEVYFDGDVVLGEAFVASAANAGQNDFTSNSWVHVLSPLDAVLQTVSMHTSCSRPLGPGDQFGSIFVAGMTTTEGGTDLFGAEVEYTYVVTNTGSSLVENVTVIDSVFGELPGSPIASIDPGDTVEITLVTLIDETTTNLVTVEGETAGGLGECEDQASATVTVIEPPAPPADCCENGRPRSLTFVYTGQGCSASNNTQSSDECSGDPAFASPVMIEVTNKENPFDSNPDVYFSGEVALGGSFEASALAVGDDHFPSNTFIHIFATSGSLLQTNEVHTSCSQPLFVGDQFGAALLTDCVGEDEPIPGDCCDAGRPRALRMEYTGEDCSASDNAQGSSECTGNPNFASPVRIIASDKSNPFDGGARIYFDGEVVLNGIFDMYASNAGEDKFESNSYVHVLSLNNNVLQTNEIHTSCSQPLFVGNQFGSIVLLDCIGQDDPPGTTFPELAQCYGDLDGDGTRGFTDLSTLLSVWGPCPSPCPADMDVDGMVGFVDLTMLLGVWGETCN